MSSVDFTAEPKTNGDLAVIEFMGALPRAKLYPNWTVNTDDTNTLQTLASPSFDLHQNVLVADSTLPAPLPANASQPAGTVDITSYLSKRIKLKANVKAPSVLLLSERYNPKWKVEVDGKPAPVLRCDFILRGVFLQPGEHTVVFRFAPTLTALYVSLTAIVLGVMLTGWLAFTRDDDNAPEKEPKE